MSFIHSFHFDIPCNYSFVLIAVALFFSFPVILLFLVLHMFREDMFVSYCFSLICLLPANILNAALNIKHKSASLIISCKYKYQTNFMNESTHPVCLQVGPTASTRTHCRIWLSFPQYYDNNLGTSSSDFSDLCNGKAHRFI